MRITTILMAGAAALLVPAAAMAQADNQSDNVTNAVASTPGADVNLTASAPAADNGVAAPEASDAAVVEEPAAAPEPRKAPQRMPWGLLGLLGLAGLLGRSRKNAS